jgi:hypothetical protein
LLVADIALHSLSSPAAAIDPANDILGALQVDIADYDRSQGLGQLESGGRADPGRTVSHNYHFSLQSLIRHRKARPPRSCPERMRYPTISDGVQEPGAPCDVKVVTGFALECSLSFAIGLQNCPARVRACSIQ